jgi:GTPase SAR1 family protein
MLGVSMVGKTALVGQFVHSIFSDRYLTTLGVKISKKMVQVADTQYMLMLWDLEGRNECSDIHLGYLRGAMGFFVVADGTRHETLKEAMLVRQRALELAGDLPHTLLVNKEDLSASWEITDSDIAQVEAGGVRVMKTSAKTGFNTAEAFMNLARAMHERFPTA